MSDPTTNGTRLNKFLALQLGLARREADEIIQQGRVRIDDQPAMLGQRVMDSHIVTVDNKLVDHTPHLQYVLFHKPVNYVCSRKKQGDSETIYAILPHKYYPLKPVGRLDRNSSGLHLLTNDGDFAHHMTHPSFHKVKQYEVEIDQDLAPLHQQMLSDYGVTLEDGISKLGLERLTDTNRRQWRVIMSEGRNRQIRRTFAALGYTVTKLHRTHFGPYTLGSLAPGETHEFTP